MKNILKLGLISAITAIALAQTPSAIQTQGMDEDVLAIASKGALSDKMQGFRKLADDEAGSIFGGIEYARQFFYRGVTDNSGTVQYYRSYYKVELTKTESFSRKINIGNGLNAADYMNFKFIEDTQRNEHVYIEASYMRGRGDSYQVVKINENTKQVIPVTYLTEFTSRLARHASTRTNYQNDKRYYFNGGR